MTTALASQLLAHLPVHQCELSITHNEHTINYQTVAQLLDEGRRRFDFDTDESFCECPPKGEL